VSEKRWFFQVSVGGGTYVDRELRVETEVLEVERGSGVRPIRDSEVWLIVRLVFEE
jgi:hypothetical protein